MPAKTSPQLDIVCWKLRGKIKENSDIKSDIFKCRFFRTKGPKVFPHNKMGLPSYQKTNVNMCVEYIRVKKR